MIRKPQVAWLPRLLFWLALTTAGALLLVPALAPFADRFWPAAKDRPRLIEVFAHDAAVRRTSLASALGLIVTACVFFRPSDRPARTPPPSRRSKTPPPAAMAGA
jgi:hypothetical protein